MSQASDEVEDLKDLVKDIKESKNVMPKGILQMMPNPSPTTDLFILTSRIVFEATNLDQVEFKIITYNELKKPLAGEKAEEDHKETKRLWNNE